MWSKTPIPLSLSAMKHVLRYVLGLGWLVWLVTACDTSFQGDVKGNQPPETYTTIDTIIRTGVDRLNSEVHIRWWGDDPDGIVVGFEYTFDQTNWRFIDKNDSVFVLSPPPGQDTVDFNFQVRSIDNEGEVDPTPASLLYPIKNSNPTIAFVVAGANPTISFPVVRYNWTASDPDGEANLNNIELAWNDTTGAVTTIDVANTSGTFIATDVTANVTDAQLYLNNNTNPESFTVPGMRLNDTNRLYIRSVDNSDARSAWVASAPIYIKKVSSPVLLVNAYNGTNVEQFYKDQLVGQGITAYDSLRIFETGAGGALTQQSPDNLTQSRIFDLFDVIIWFGNNAEKSLSLAQRTTADFFADGGKMLMAVYVSSVFDDQSQFFDFTPIESLVEFSDTTLILTDTSQLFPAEAGWPILRSTQFVGVVKPINASIGVAPLFDASLLANDRANGVIFNWPGNDQVIVKQTANGQTNFIMSVLELQNLNGNGNLDQFFQKVLIDEFGL